MPKKFKIMEYVSLVRTYEVEAEDEDLAVEVMESGEVEPIDITEQYSEIEIKEV